VRKPSDVTGWISKRSDFHFHCFSETVYIFVDTVRKAVISSSGLIKKAAMKTSGMEASEESRRVVKAGS
jgi:hypothetical protein